MPLRLDFKESVRLLLTEEDGDASAAVAAAPRTSWEALEDEDPDELLRLREDRLEADLCCCSMVGAWTSTLNLAVAVTFVT